MDTRVRRQVNARVSFVCLFVFSCIFNVLSIFTVSFDSKGRQRQNVFIWIKVYSFCLRQQNLMKQITITKKPVSLARDGKLIDLAQEPIISSQIEFSRQKYH